MCWLLGCLQFIIISVVTIYEFKRKSPSVFMWATLLIMFGIMHMINSFIGDQSYSNTVLIEASNFVILFCLLYLFVRIILKRTSSYSTENAFRYKSLEEQLVYENNNDWLLLSVFIIALLFKIVPLIKYAGDIFSFSWGKGRAYSATLDYMNSGQLFKIIFFSLSGLILLMVIRKDIKWILVTFLVLFEVLVTRNRIEILPIFCSFLAIIVFKKDKLNIKTIIAAVALGIGIIYIVYALRVYRHYGTLTNFINLFNFDDFNEKIFNYITTDNGELGLRRGFYFFINGNNQFENFGKMHSYIRMLLVYIPTGWSFGIKPPDFAISMGQAIGMSIGGSTHPTLFGDCYANLGFFGFLLGGFWAIYTSVAESFLKKRTATTRILMYVLNAVTFVIIGRGSVYNAFWTAAFGIPLLIILDYLVTHVKKPKIKVTIRKNKGYK